jgi:hypothetical protein
MNYRIELSGYGSDTNVKLWELRTQTMKVDWESVNYLVKTAIVSDGSEL